MSYRLSAEQITTLSPRRAPVVVRSPEDPRYSEHRLGTSLRRMLKATELCAIATVTRSGQAHISHLYFCWSPELAIYFLSDPRSLHCRNLQSNPSMAMTVYRSDQPWDRPGRGVQLWGRCAEARGTQAAEAERLYAKRFPECSELRGSGSAAHNPFRYRFYRFIPRKIKILDEEEFGGGVFVTAAIRRA